MASCQTSQWTSTSPYVKLTVTQSSSTDTTATLSWTLQYIASSAANTSTARSYSVVINGSTVKSGTYSINGVSGTKTISSGTISISKTHSSQTISFSVSFAFNLTWSGSYAGTKSASSSISVAAKTKYTVSYNANNGSGVPSSQTKWYGETLTLSSTKPTRTGYSFLGWSTSSSATTATYSAGGSYTANSGATLYAVWKANTYIVKYNANGGSGAPGNQTKTYGVTLTLSTTKPTRTNYNFLGWSTSASATTATYQAGGSYTANAGVTLYAVWSLAYTKPRINNFSVERCVPDTASDTGYSVNEEGTYALVKFDYECDQTISSIVIKWSSTLSSGTKTVTSTGLSGSVSEIIGDDDISIEATYTVSVAVTDTNGHFELSKTLAGMVLPIDIKSGGKGIAFGKPAESDGIADFGWDAKFNKPVYGTVMGLDRLPEIVANSDFNDYLNYGCWAVYYDTAATTISNIPTKLAGRLEVSSSTGGGDRGGTTWKYVTQRYIPYKVSEGEWVRLIIRKYDSTGDSVSYDYGDWMRKSIPEVVLYSGSSSNGTINLSSYASDYRYLEIYYCDNNGKCGGCSKVYVSSTAQVCLSIVESSSGVTWFKQAVYAISGKTITPQSYTIFSVSSSGTVSINANSGVTNMVKIFRVVGIK